jgi:hypothetical protein
MTVGNQIARDTDKDHVGQVLHAAGDYKEE